VAYSATTGAAAPLVAFETVWHKIAAQDRGTRSRHKVAAQDGGTRRWQLRGRRLLSADGCGMAGQDREPLCRCGHGRSAHRHYRRGSDCALCDCPRWRPHGWLRGLLRRRAA